jgi:hypothetical protein
VKKKKKGKEKQKQAEANGGHVLLFPPECAILDTGVPGCT